MRALTGAGDSSAGAAGRLAEADQAELKLVLHPVAEPLVSHAKPATLAFLIGPEGGLSDAKSIRPRARFPCRPPRPRVLRTETAPVVAWRWPSSFGAISNPVASRLPVQMRSWEPARDGDAVYGNSTDHYCTGSLTGLAMIALSSLVIGNSRFKPFGGIGCSNQRW
jgi:hypothetical protein